MMVALCRKTPVFICCSSIYFSACFMAAEIFPHPEHFLKVFFCNQIVPAVCDVASRDVPVNRCWHALLGGVVNRVRPAPLSNIHINGAPLCIFSHIYSPAVRRRTGDLKYRRYITINNNMIIKPCIAMVYLAH